MLRILVFVCALTVNFYSWSEQSIQTPQVNPKQKTESTIQNKQDSNNAENPSKSEQATITNCSDTKKSCQNSSNEGTEFYPSLYGFRFKVTDSLLVLFTAILAIFTGLLWCSTKKLWGTTKDSVDLAREEFIASHRPKIIVRNFGIMDGEIPNGKPINIFFVAANIGESTGKIVEVRSATVVLGAKEELPLDFSFPFSEKFDFNLVSGTHEVFPANGCTPLENTESMKVYAGDYAFYCIGTLAYIDEIGIRRETGFCRRYYSREGRWEVIGSQYEYTY